MFQLLSKVVRPEEREEKLECSETGSDRLSHSHEIKGRLTSQKFLIVVSVFVQ